MTKLRRLRAIGGGGRFDDLLKQFGGPDIPATGFGIGDCVLSILLEEKGLLKPRPQQLDYFVACVDESFRDAVVEVTMRLRSKRFAANFSYKAVKLSKQLKQASDKNAQKCIIIGEEFKDNQLLVKDMETGEQLKLDINEFFSQLESKSR
jgi:histidyl-tRNA synthetase